MVDEALCCRIDWITEDASVIGHAACRAVVVSLRQEEVARACSHCRRCSHRAHGSAASAMQIRCNTFGNRVCDTTLDSITGSAPRTLIVYCHDLRERRCSSDDVDVNTLARDVRIGTFPLQGTVAQARCSCLIFIVCMAGKSNVLTSTIARHRKVCCAGSRVLRCFDGMQRVFSRCMGPDFMAFYGTPCMRFMRFMRFMRCRRAGNSAPGLMRPMRGKHRSEAWLTISCASTDSVPTPTSVGGRRDTALR